MYQVLFVTNKPDLQSKLTNDVDWQGMSFRLPIFASTAEEAITMVERKRVDCIGYSLDAGEARTLYRYLTTMRPSLPIVQIRRDAEDQKKVLIAARRVLDNLHMDISDEEIDEETVLAMLRDELTHDLLVGNLTDEDNLRARLQILRAHVSLDKQCVLYDFDLPQGEVYLNTRWHYGSERLENSLRTNFFGRYHEDLYYMVAVLNPRHIRVVVCQRLDREDEMEERLLLRADEHVQQVIDNIKEYLNLDMVLRGSEVLPNLCVLVQA